MQKDGFYTGMVYKKDRCSTGVVYKKLILDGSGIQKHGFRTGLVYRRMGFRREWYTKG